MGHLDDALDTLRRFPDLPPVPASHIGAIEARARRIRRTRRLTKSALAVVLALAGVTAGSVVLGSDGRESVEVTESPVDEPTTSTVPPASEATAAPSTGLDDGDEVVVTFEREVNWQAAAQCAVEATETNDTSWCDINARPASESPDGRTLRFEVVRLIQTGNGLVDCAEEPGRCILGAYATSGEPMWAAISFRDDLPPIERPSLEVSRDDVVDGDVIRVRGRGFPSERDVHVRLCAGPEALDCDIARGQGVLTDAEGAFSVDFIVYSQILTYRADGWRSCEPCELRVTAIRSEPASVPIEVRPGGEPRRPRVDILEPGPYRLGQPVTLRGTNFQAGSETRVNGYAVGHHATIGRCAITVGSEYPSCSYPTIGLEVAPDSDGRFRLSGYPMPDEDFAQQCTEPGRCVLAWHPGEGSPPAFETPFTMAP